MGKKIRTEAVDHNKISNRNSIFNFITLKLYIQEVSAIFIDF